MVRKRAAALTTALGALMVAVSASAQQAATPTDFVPDYTFKGSQLTGWRPMGQADWKAENGELVGTPRGGGGWLVMGQSYQDAVLFTRFRCASPCNAGVLLRAQQTPQGMKGIYVSLADPDLAAYKVNLDSNGQIVSRDKVSSAGGQIRIAPATPVAPPAAGLAAGQAAPPAQAGAAAAAAAGRAPGAGGGQPQGPRIRPNDWNDLQVYIDANIVRPGLNGGGGIASGNTDDSSTGYGPIALYVGPGSEVRYKDLAVKDLQLRKIPPEKTSSRFTMQRLDEFAYAWDAAVADINRDGVNDIVAGPFYYIGPNYTTRREIYLGQTFNPSIQYPNNMVTHAADFTGDGWPDVLATESRPMVLYVNPKGENHRWERFEVLPGVTTENTLIRDVNKDGKPDVVYGIAGTIAWASPNPASPTSPWPVHKISQAVTGAVNVHGLGVGDVNGDGRMDILHAAGWWEQPGSLSGDPLWTYHPFAFANAGDINGGGGGEMSVFDVNGDGKNDVVTSLNAHGWGLAWFEQQRDASGNITFSPHLVMGNENSKNAGGVLFSELHSGVMPADIDGDGRTDIVTGKRFWAHLESYTDPDPMGEAVLYWYRNVKNPNAPGGAEFVPELIHNRSGVGSQFEVTDVNKDGAPDIVTSGMKGTFVFWGKRGAR
jgi:hypothetical protein